MTRSVLFLDFDDVICLNKTCGGYDAINALSRAAKEPDLNLNVFAELWEQLFDDKAKVHLKALHEEFSPWYVLTTSWWWHMEKEQLVEVLCRCGLRFVAENLHASWDTPKGMRPEERSHEISNWHSRHPECDELWVVLDDEVSGTGLADWPITMDRPFIVLCRENFGLTDVEYRKLRAAFLLRKAGRVAA